MGVRGLYTYVETKEAYDIVDLIEIATEKKGIEILVDFYAYGRYLLELLYRRMASENNNPFLLLSGGEYDILYQAFYKYHKIFYISGIKFVYFIDGPKNLDNQSSDQKKNMRIEENIKYLMQCNAILLACKSNELPHKDLDIFFPLNSFEVALEGLKDAGAEIIQLLQSESDEYIALQFQKRKSYAIITNNTEFLIFPKCKVIFTQMMNSCYNSDNLMLPFWDNENRENLFKNPSSFQCPVVTQDHILKLLQLESCEQLVAMSILNGKGKILPFSDKLRYEFRKIVNYSKDDPVTVIAKYVKVNSITINNILHHSPITEISRNYAELIPAIEFHREFYSLERIKKIDESLIIYKQGTIEDPLTKFFADKFSRSELWKGIYSLHHGVINDSILIEEPSRMCPQISTILSEMNDLVYPHIIKAGHNEVKEYRCRDNNEVNIFTVNIQSSPLKSNDILSSSSDIKRSGIDYFEKVWSHLEQEESLNYVKEFGFECGFLCYLLRYFYMITNDRNLRVSPDEFKALFITVFYHYARAINEELQTKIQRKTFLGMNIFPSEKCMIINTWFLRIFCHGKYLCGGAFNLTDKFPSLRHVINASILYGFYEHIMNDQNQRTQHLDDREKILISNLADEIFKRYQTQYAMITKCDKI